MIVDLMRSDESIEQRLVFRKVKYVYVGESWIFLDMESGERKTFSKAENWYYSVRPER